MRIYARKLNRRSLRVASVMLENYYPPFITSSLSFKFFPAIRYIVSYRSTLPFHSLLSTSFLSFPTLSIWFIYLFLSFSQGVSSRYVLPFVSNSYIPFVYLFVSLQLVHFICYFFPLVSTLAFHSLLLPFRFNSSLPFATSFLSFQLFPSVRYFLCSFQRFHPVRLPLLSFSSH